MLRPALATEVNERGKSKLREANEKAAPSRSTPVAAALHQAASATENAPGDTHTGAEIDDQAFAESLFSRYKAALSEQAYTYQQS